MRNPTFSDATLVLLGHGSTLNAESAAPVWRHADALRETGVFGRVIEGFWKQEPGFAGVLRGCTGRRAFVVPLFVSHGYFTDEVMPRELGFPKSTDEITTRRMVLDGREIHLCEPVGTHPLMADLIVERARDVIARHPFPHAPRLTNVTLFVAGHGTSQNENSREAIETAARAIRARGVFRDARAIFMEEPPLIAECHGLSATRAVAVVPFFISDGLHSREDIPVMLGEAAPVVQKRLAAGQAPWRNPTERKERLIWYADGIGSSPIVRDIVLQRVREAAGPEQ